MERRGGVVSALQEASEVPLKVEKVCPICRFSVLEGIPAGWS